MFVVVFVVVVVVVFVVVFVFDFRSYVDWLARRHLAKDSHQDQECRTNYITDLFQNCRVPEEVSGTFDT